MVRISCQNLNRCISVDIDFLSIVTFLTGIVKWTFKQVYFIEHFCTEWLCQEHF